MPDCTTCGEAYHPKRHALGYRTCLKCGDRDASSRRAGWAIVPSGHKQGYTLLSNKADLKGLNKYVPP